MKYTTVGAAMQALIARALRKRSAKRVRLRPLSPPVSAARRERRPRTRERPQTITVAYRMRASSFAFGAPGKSARRAGLRVAHGSCAIE
jgi:hypothetical protein